MDNSLESPFLDFGKQIISYLPNVLGGAILLLVGWLIGWLIKRITIQLLVVLRFERLFMRVQWRKALSKADVRYAVFNLIGNIVFFIVFLIFLNSALDTMRLTVLSSLIQQGVLFIPKFIIALLIFGLGWIVASRVSNSVYNALLKEKLPHYSIISRFVKFVAVLFVTAMALVEIEIAPQIVIIGFTTIMITLGIILISITVFSGKSSVSNFLNIVEKKEK
jgi:hypothetical protein